MREQTLSDSNLSLFAQVHSEDRLREAFREVKRNKGSPGIDGVTVEMFEANLSKELGKLKQEVESYAYVPHPVRRVETSKPNGGIRILGVPAVRGRVLQASLRGVIEPMLEPMFSPNSYGFGP